MIGKCVHGCSRKFKYLFMISVFLSLQLTMLSIYIAPEFRKSDSRTQKNVRPDAGLKQL